MEFQVDLLTMCQSRCMRTIEIVFCWRLDVRCLNHEDHLHCRVYDGDGDHKVNESTSQT